MSTVHKNYNLIFLNQRFEGTITKTCEIKSKSASPNFIALSTYLIYMQYVESFTEWAIPEVDKALDGELDIDVSCESVDVEVDAVETKIFWNGVVETLPTNDFRVILIEFATFLQTPTLY